ncbi:iron ABC transporter permease [Nocardioides sp. HDW12B]|uniref:FecCD family ABC transporter permease n=1 Tax=Nocardioides sp. HDW12B TaxID=2714939 RepID=UPI00140A4AE4|nr:iron ABC transporter permease [Nocardioides sp. HDW12B]QIK67765.1 iron ABC transporter permease [Nocardioides sp. HDW12B]
MSTRVGTGTGPRVGLGVALGAAVLLSVLVGSQAVSPLALLDGADPGHAIALVRLDRTLVALAAGAALGVAGACAQGLTRNPLADPGLLGVNAGAALGMIVAIAYLGISDLSGYVWFAFAGAALAAVVVHAVASAAPGGATPVTLVVTGAAISALATSWVSAVLLIDRTTMDTFRFWMVGTVGGRQLETVAVVGPFLLVGLALAWFGRDVLDNLALGDELARGLGGHPGRDRVLVGLAVVLLAGGATALAGPIAFVGLVVPHAARILLGPGHARIVPASALLGGVLTVLADTAGRVVLPPTEVQVGIMTAVLGAPVFIVLCKRSRTVAL